jgi:hypothetical protein
MNTPDPNPGPSVPTPLPSFFDSGVIRSLLTALAMLIGTIATVFFGVDESAFNQTAEKLIGALVVFLAVGGPIFWAMWQRATRPTPPITQKAIDATVKREEQMAAAGTSSPGVMPTSSGDGGSVKPLSVLLLLAVPLFAMLGCQGTLNAYRAAEDLEDTAYVLSEQWDALVVEGTRLRDSGTLNGSELANAQRVELRVRPVVLKLGEAARAWESVKSADNEKALELAIADAIPALRELIDALKVGRDPSADGPSAELQRIEFKLAEVA